MGPTYKALLGSLMLDQPLLAPAALFYLLYVLGCLVFAVQPALARGSWLHSTRLGALLGLVAYGTYDLSNWSTLHGWSAQLALLDMAWGTFASAVACSIGEEKWRARVNSEVLAPPATNGDVVVQTQDDRLIGLDASTGNQRWTYDSTPGVLT